MTRRTWTEKLNAEAAVVVKPAPIDFAGMKAGEIMLVPTAGVIDAFVRELPRGRYTTIAAMRADLARRFGARVTCPIYTGFHVRTVAEAAFEAHSAGAPLTAITPFWRLIDERTATARRLACGLDFIRERRREEGLDRGQ
jgi:hypothetical protein